MPGTWPRREPAATADGRRTSEPTIPATHRRPCARPGHRHSYDNGMGTSTGVARRHRGGAASRRGIQWVARAILVRPSPSALARGATLVVARTVIFAARESFPSPDALAWRRGGCRAGMDSVGGGGENGGKKENAGRWGGDDPRSSPPVRGFGRGGAAPTTRIIHVSHGDGSRGL